MKVIKLTKKQRSEIALGLTMFRRAGSFGRCLDGRCVKPLKAKGFIEESVIGNFVMTDYFIRLLEKNNVNVHGNESIRCLMETPIYREYKSKCLEYLGPPADEPAKYITMALIAHQESRKEAGCILDAIGKESFGMRNMTFDEIPEYLYEKY